MNRILSVRSLPGHLLELIFQDGLCKVVDLKPFIGPGLSADLLDDEYFRKVEIESGGGIYWPNGYDFCPNFLHDEVPAVSTVTA
jgi:hypothetical protein